MWSALFLYSWLKCNQNEERSLEYRKFVSVKN
ncbi:hypothetical protein CPL00151_CDS0105 [Escherichia phage Delraymugoa]